MTGGLMQLVAYGAQDIYLTGDPMITHFKSIYRRHTNFAMERIEQQFNGTPNFGMTLSAIICRNGDLISGACIETTLPDLNVDNDTIVNRWTENVGHHLIKSVDIEIGGQLIDRHYGEWLDIWAQLTVSANHKTGYYNMIGQGAPDALSRPTGLQKDINGAMTKGRTLLIPLQFWFCRNIGLALPLICLEFHEVKINVVFAEVSELIRSSAILGTNRLSNTKLWIDYIYLDIEERRRFMETAHEYLIEQLQVNTSELIVANLSKSQFYNQKVNLNLNHPVKELIWVVKASSYLTGLNRQPSNYTSVSAQLPVDQVEDGIDGYSKGGLSLINLLSKVKMLNQSSVIPPGASNPVISAKLTLNGHDRIQTLSGDYFNLMQPLKYHTNIPQSPGINVYSFALNPEAHEPSGSCNFSKIDNAYLTLNIANLQNKTYEAEYPGAIKSGEVSNILYASSTCIVTVYAVNYNILRVMNGLGGVAYTN